MTGGSLIWNEKSGYGDAHLTKEFLEAHRVVQLDALQGWIADLQFLYDSMMGKKSGPATTLAEAHEILKARNKRFESG